jgi:hypothetical protein
MPPKKDATLQDLLDLLAQYPPETEMFVIGEFKKKKELMAFPLNLTHPQKPHYKYFQPDPEEQTPPQLVLGKWATNIEST